MHGYTIDCADSTLHGTGIEIWPSGGKTPNIHVTARVRGSTVRGCDDGLYYQDSQGERVDADFECSELADNKVDNVTRCDCSTNPCQCVEQCP